MSNSKQYRVKVAEYKERGKKTDAPNEIREFKNLGRTFTEMADIFGRSDNAVIRLRVLRVSQAPGSSMSACHGKHRAVDLLARSRDHYGRPDGGSEQRHESCELSRRGCSKMPTLRFRDQEIAKYLDASDRLQFLGINEIGVERDGVGFAKKLHQSAILFDQIVRQ
jgi:hypothetical protein